MRRFIALGCLGLALPFAAQAEDWTPKVRTGMEFQGKTDLKRGNGDFNFWLWNLGGDVEGEIAEDLTLTFDAEYTAIGYDFDNGAIGEAWETVHVVRLSPLFDMHVTDQWSIRVGPFIEFAGESQANFGESLAGGGILGVRYTMSEQLSVGVGVLVRSEIEDDPYVQPWLTASWDATEDLNVSLLGGTSRGGQLRVGYTFFDDFEAAFEGGFRRERFRLNTDRPSVRRKGVGQEEAVVANVRFVWNFLENAAAEAYVGLTADGEFRLENKRGDKIVDSDYDDAAMGGFQIRYAF